MAIFRKAYKYGNNTWAPIDSGATQWLDTETSEEYLDKMGFISMNAYVRRANYLMDRPQENQVNQLLTITVYPDMIAGTPPAGAHNYKMAGFIKFRDEDGGMMAMIDEMHELVNLLRDADAAIRMEFRDERRLK